MRGTKRAATASLFYGTKRLATVLPLALPGRHGDLIEGELLQTSTGGASGTPTTRKQAMCLQLRQAAQARRLFAPLWFDLDCRRPQRLTWRPLSIGQAMQVQSADTAVGFRVAAAPANGCSIVRWPSRAAAPCWAII